MTTQNGPCAKQIVTCTLLHPDGRRWVGRNDVENPQATCPRGQMLSGVGYELCRSVCGQNGHAEEQALKAAGANAQGCTAYVEGIHYVCMNCQIALTRAGVKTMVLGTPPTSATAGVDLDKLEALARAATRGPWKRSERLNGPFWHISSDHTVGGELCKSGKQAIAAVHGESKKGATAYAAMFEANADFIAAANPAAILALTDLARRAQPRVAEQAIYVDESALEELAQDRFGSVCADIYKATAPGRVRLTQQAAPEAPAAATDQQSATCRNCDDQGFADGGGCAYCGRMDPVREYADQPSAGQVDERALFEAAFIARVQGRQPLRKLSEEDIETWLARNSNDESRYLHAQEAWEGWQAGRASLTPTAPQAADTRALCMLVAEAVHRNATGGKAMPGDQVRAIVDEVLAAQAASRQVRPVVCYGASKPDRECPCAECVSERAPQAATTWTQEQLDQISRSADEILAKMGTPRMLGDDGSVINAATTASASDGSIYESVSRRADPEGHAEAMAQMESVLGRAPAPSLEAAPLTKAQIDDIVYQCRQSGNDTTYDIVNAAIRAALAGAPLPGGK